MTITPEILVNREVHYCVSYLVSTLAQGYGQLDSSAAELSEAAEQAAELCYGLDDWEEAAFQAGWFLKYHQQDEPYFAKEGEEDFPSDDWQELCEAHDIEPYQREVYEHWIVSDWLADRLSEQGEKVDKDFAGLTVWARTTTGQGIASDSVIERICADLNRGA